MTIRNLEGAARPSSVAVFGASDREGSVGRIIMRNIATGGFAGEIWPINPKYRNVGGRRCYGRVKDVPGVPDLAVIATPPQTIPGLVSDLGKKGTRVAVVITAGITRENGLRQAMLDAARPYLFRIIGPNTVGLIVPHSRLNASFSHMGAQPGGLALLSQSGAIATSLIDWAADEGIGFSHVVSLGDMADVDVGDYLDMLAGDRDTRAILMYLETVPAARKFISAARAAARIKPVIAIKAGRHEAAARAAATHTGALSGADKIVDAALRRAGILRVIDLGELFAAAETLARFRPLRRNRLAIVTNGGGAGVLAVDKVADFSGELAALSAATVSRLDTSLPANWSRANPVDIIGDAPPQRYSEAIATVAKDDSVDAILVMNCPTGLASTVDAANAVARLATDGTVADKPVLACWLGEQSAREGREVLQRAGIACFASPELAIAAVSHLGRWSRAQVALSRVPSSRSEDVVGDRQAVQDVFRRAASERRAMLTEPEAKAVIAAYGIEVPETITATTPDEVEEATARLLGRVPSVVVKLLSREISHKSDVGGVVLDVRSSVAAGDAAREIVDRLSKAGRKSEIDGFVVQPMVVRKHSFELILGMTRDPIFGPSILFGAGGTAVEIVDDTAIALPPLDSVLAGDLIDNTRIGLLLAGYRDRKPADRANIVQALNAISQLVVDFPCIESMDINPLLADSEGSVALDARIEISPADAEREGPNPDLAIRPYPSGWEAEEVLGGTKYHVRPIKPLDVSLYPDFLSRISPNDIRLRFLAPRRHFTDEMLLRLTQLDYDRDIAFVALDADTGKLAGIGRYSSDPDKYSAEFALLVRSDLQGRGLGWALLQKLIDYGRADGLARLEGTILSENTKMLDMCRQFGFQISHAQEPGASSVVLKLR